MNSKVSVKVIKPKPVVPPAVYKLTLNLSDRDARAILSLCYQVSGAHEDKSARGVFDEISSELRKVGLTRASSATEITTRVHFNSYSDYKDDSV